jgi:YggT family protein
LDLTSRVDTRKTVNTFTTKEFFMTLIGTLVGYALTVFVLLLLARLVLDWVGVLADAPSWTNRARALTHTWTEPVIAPVRKVLRPIRAGGLSIDLAFTAVFVVALILRTIAFSV